MNVWTNTYAKKCTYGEYLNKCMDKYVKKYMDELQCDQKKIAKCL